MYADVDAAITPRPHYPADGRKMFGLYSAPASLHERIEQQIGEFPFPSFWGPAAGIASSRWIVDCAIAEFQLNRPDLQLIYLPHLDYSLQRLGPDHPSIADEVRAIDSEVGRLLDFAQAQGAAVMLLSEYGIEAVTQSVSINRLLRAEGLLQVRQSLTWELLDPGASAAFAVADHQVAHIYVKQARDIPASRRCCNARPASNRYWIKPNNRPGNWIIPAAASWWPSPPPVTGSITTTGSTRARLPTLPAPWTSIASQATTRSSCSSTRPFASRH